jgi:hypothetical protein
VPPIFPPRIVRMLGAASAGRHLPAPPGRSFSSASDPRARLPPDRTASPGMSRAGAAAAAAAAALTAGSRPHTPQQTPPRSPRSLHAGPLPEQGVNTAPQTRSCCHGSMCSSGTLDFSMQRPLRRPRAAGQQAAWFTLPAQSMLQTAAGTVPSSSSPLHPAGDQASPRSVASSHAAPRSPGHGGRRAANSIDIQPLFDDGRAPQQQQRNARQPPPQQAASQPGSARSVASSHSVASRAAQSDAGFFSNTRTGRAGSRKQQAQGAAPAPRGGFVLGPGVNKAATQGLVAAPQRRGSGGGATPLSGMIVGRQVGLLPCSDLRRCGKALLMCCPESLVSPRPCT